MKMEIKIQCTLVLNEVFSVFKEKMKPFLAQTKDGFIWRNPMIPTQCLTIQAFADNSAIYHVLYQGEADQLPAILKYLLKNFKMEIRQLHYLVLQEGYSREDCCKTASRAWREEAPYMFRCDTSIHCLLMEEHFVFHSRAFSKLENLKEALARCEQYLSVIVPTVPFDLFTYDQLAQITVQ